MGPHNLVGDRRPGSGRNRSAEGDSGTSSRVDHREIFRDYEQFLPTNSYAIETMLWRIEVWPIASCTSTTT
jgi:hypothetical protein